MKRSAKIVSPESFVRGLFTLTPAQEEDARMRFKSFKQRGILRASIIKKILDHPILSAEQSFQPETCLNVIDFCNLSIKKVNDALQYLQLDDTIGFLNMAIERSEVALFSDEKAFQKELQQRLFCNFIFVCKLSSYDRAHYVGERSLRSALEGEHKYVFELRKKTDVPAESILAILVPTPLLALAKESFPDSDIFEAPMRPGSLGLSGFTQATAIDCTVTDMSDIQCFVPCYPTAIREMQARKGIQQFATHITRVATTSELQKPFVHRSAQDRSALEGLMKDRILAKSHSPGFVPCKFKADSYHCYAVPRDVVRTLKARDSYATEIFFDKSNALVMVFARSSLFKHSSKGGLRDKIGMCRVGCHLSDAQYEHFKHHEPFITVEQGLDKTGASTYLITCPEALLERVKYICKDWSKYVKEKSCVTIQSVFKSQRQRQAYLGLQSKQTLAVAENKSSLDRHDFEGAQKQLTQLLEVRHAFAKT